MFSEVCSFLQLIPKLMCAQACMILQLHLLQGNRNPPLIVTGFMDGSAAVFNASNGALLCHQSCHRKYCVRVRWLTDIQDRNLFVTASWDSSVGVHALTGDRGSMLPLGHCSSDTSCCCRTLIIDSLKLTDYSASLQNNIVSCAMAMAIKYHMCCLASESMDISRCRTVRRWDSADPLGS